MPDLNALFASVVAALGDGYRMDGGVYDRTFHGAGGSARVVFNGVGKVAVCRDGFQSRNPSRYGFFDVADTAAKVRKLCAESAAERARKDAEADAEEKEWEAEEKLAAALKSASGGLCKWEVNTKPNGEHYASVTVGPLSKANAEKLATVLREFALSL